MDRMLMLALVLTSCAGPLASDVANGQESCDCAALEERVETLEQMPIRLEYADAYVGFYPAEQDPDWCEIAALEPGEVLIRAIAETPAWGWQIEGGFPVHQIDQSVGYPGPGCEKNVLGWRLVIATL